MGGGAFLAEADVGVVCVGRGCHRQDFDLLQHLLQIPNQALGRAFRQAEPDLAGDDDGDAVRTDLGEASGRRAVGGARSETTSVSSRWRGVGLIAERRPGREAGVDIGELVVERFQCGQEVR